jgi:hypothetical protein
MEKLTRIGAFWLIVAMCCGCASVPRSLHPSQLWKLNRQDAWDEGTFSIPDPVDSRPPYAPATDMTRTPTADSGTR